MDFYRRERLMTQAYRTRRILFNLKKIARIEHEANPTPETQNAWDVLEWRYMKACDRYTRRYEIPYEFPEGYCGSRRDDEFAPRSE